MGYMTYSQRDGGPPNIGGAGPIRKAQEYVDVVLTRVPLLRRGLIIVHRIYEKAVDAIPYSVRTLPRTVWSKFSKSRAGSKTALFGGGLGGRVNNAMYAHIGHEQVDSAIDYHENLSTADFDDDDDDEDSDDVEAAVLFDSTRGISEALNASDKSTDSFLKEK